MSVANSSAPHGTLPDVIHANNERHPASPFDNLDFRGRVASHFPRGSLNFV